MEKTAKTSATKTIVGLGLLTAIVVVLQFVSMWLRFSAFSITLTLVPIVVGAALYGWKAGAWLGFVFGLAVLLTGDANVFLAINPVGTVVTVLLKGALSGLCTGIMYRLISAKSRVAAVLASAITAPVVNTGIFFLGSLVFFYDTLKEAGGGDVISYIFVGLIGFNFFIELGINLVLNPAIVLIIKQGKKSIANSNN